MAWYQYDPTKVRIIVAAIPVTGLADGDMATVEFSTDTYTTHIGTQGEGRHIKSADRSGMITIRLADYSPSNGAFSIIAKLDIPVPIAVIDKHSNGDLFFSSDCVIRKIPNLQKGSEAKVNEWVWTFTKGTINHGGAKVRA